MQTETTIDNQVSIIHNSIELFRSAPEILKTNQERTRKAVAVGNTILQQWAEAWKIEDEEERMKAMAVADERSNKFLVNCNAALKEQKELRAAITQMMDQFKKMFTDAENEIDRTKANSVPAKVQNNRDTYVQEAAKIQERKRKEAERIAAKAKEAIDIEYEMATSLSSQYNQFLATKKQSLVTAFNNITLENYNEKSTSLKGYEPDFKFQPQGPYTSRSQYHEAEELKAIAQKVVGEKMPEYKSNYAAEMILMRDELIEKLPSKYNELQEQKRLADEAEAEAERQRIEEQKRQEAIAKANAAQKAKLEEEARIAREKEAERLAKLKAEQEAAAEERKKREDQEAARLKAEAEEAQRIAEQEAEIKKQGEQTMVMFEQEAALVDSAAAPEARQGYDIVILHQAAYVQIFQFWFENEGKNLAIDKMGNTKLDQMKSWAEKFAHKTGTKIESKFLRYEESFKAVNRKAK